MGQGVHIRAFGDRRWEIGNQKVLYRGSITDDGRSPLKLIVDRSHQIVQLGLFLESFCRMAFQVEKVCMDRTSEAICIVLLRWIKIPILALELKFD
jgi:hypothetical protein